MLWYHYNMMLWHRYIMTWLYYILMYDIMTLLPYLHHNIMMSLPNIMTLYCYYFLTLYFDAVLWCQCYDVMFNYNIITLCYPFHYASVIMLHYAYVIMIPYFYVCRVTCLVYVLCIDIHRYAGTHAWICQYVHMHVCI